MNKKKLERDISELASNTTCTIEHLELIKAIIIGAKTNYEKEKLPEILMRLLPSMEKDAFYRKIWAESIMEDVKSFDSNKDIKISNSKAKEIAEAYVNSKYDCNLSYWDNIQNLILDMAAYEDSKKESEVFGEEE